MSIGRRIDVALAQAKMLPEMSASILERSSPSAEQDLMPRDRRGLLFEETTDGVFQAFERRIRLILEALEQEVDAHRFGIGVIGSGKDYNSMEERDKRLLKWTAEGMSPRQISELDPGQGSPLTIRRQLRRLREDV